MAIGAYIKIGGVYKPTTDLRIKIDGSYRQVTAAYMKFPGSGYQQVYTGSDPVTYYFHLAQAKTGRVGEWRTPIVPTDYLRSGAYVDSGVVSRNFSIFTLTNDTTGVPLATRLAERPVVKAAILTLFRGYTSHGYQPAYGNIFVGKYNSYYTDAEPNFNAIDFSVSASNVFSSLYLGDQLNIDLASAGLSSAQSLINSALTVPLLFGNQNIVAQYQGYATYQDTDYVLFETTSAETRRPFITLTLDYM